MDQGKNKGRTCKREGEGESATKVQVIKYGAYCVTGVFLGHSPRVFVAFPGFSTSFRLFLLLTSHVNYRNLLSIDSHALCYLN